MDEIQEVERASIAAPSPVAGAVFIPLWGAAIAGARGAPQDRVVVAWATIDADMEQAFSCFRWHMTDTGYAARWSGSRGARYRVRMHRLVLGLDREDPRQVDHVDRDKLHNRRQNLRAVERDSQNKQNVPGRPGSSRHRGVSWDSERGKWLAQAKAKGVGRFVKRFDSEEQAAAAVTAWRRENMPFSSD